MPNTTAKLTRPNMRMFAELIEEAVQSVAKHHGVTIKYDGARFSDTDGTIKLKITTQGETGTAHTDKLAALAGRIGLTAYDIQRKFLHAGFVYHVVDIKLGRPKFPVVVMREDGRQFKMPAYMVKSAPTWNG